MKDDLVGQALYAYRKASGKPSEDAAGYKQHLAGIEAALAIARPAILEEAAKVGHKAAWSAEREGSYPIAEAVYEAIRALSTTGQEGGR